MTLKTSLGSSCLSAAFLCASVALGQIQKDTKAVPAHSALSNVTAVDLLGTVTANQVINGLGFNIAQAGYTQEWQFAAAQAAGATWVRIQCSWRDVEGQTPPPENRSTGFKQASYCVNALTLAKAHGLHPTMLAAYGPPTHTILVVAVPHGAPVGASSISLQLVSSVGGENFSNVHFPYDYFGGYPNGGVFTPLGSDYGSLITGIKITDSAHATITLSSALETALPGPVTLTCSVGGDHTRTMTCPSGAFSSTFFGSQVTIPGAGPGGSSFATTVDGILSSTQVDLRSSAANPVTNVSVPVLPQFAINEQLYPSTATTSPTDPSVIAYGNYVSFLASDMASRGISGDIELWNEPPWADDPWDNRCAYYDADLHPPCPTSPGPDYPGTANFGFVADLQKKTLPAGVTLTWNGTSANGLASILSPDMPRQTGGVHAAQPARVVTRESFHPYGVTPEEVMFETSCLAAAAAKKVLNASDPAGEWQNCILPGESTTANFMAAVWYSYIAKNQARSLSFGEEHDITETGYLPVKPGQRVAQARFVMRQFLGFQADGITPIEFFLMSDPSGHPDPNFSFVEVSGGNSYVPNPQYTAISGFMADIRPISNLPAASVATTALPSVTSYSGSYPLTTVHMVGSRARATANSDMFTLWQRTYVPFETPQPAWSDLPSPPAVPVTVNIPVTLHVTSVIDTITRSPVVYTTVDNTITFNVADDPIGVLVDPSTNSLNRSISGPHSIKGREVIK